MSPSKGRFRNVFNVLFAATLAVACQPDTVTDVAAKPSARTAVDALDRVTADARKARVANADYELFIDLHSNPDEFAGKARLRFDLNDNSSDLSIDFGGGTIRELRVNDEPVEIDHNGFFIVVSAAALQRGPNTIDISYQHAYGEDGTGLHRFVDPEDGSTYLYTYLWPYYANRLFPSFDQPNLKATFSLSVLAPQSWEVVSMAEGAADAADNGARLWRFATTPKMSTYVFSLHAGPYQIWEDKAGAIPLRLLARKSLAPYVAVEEWFDVTRAGLAHYASYFEIPYPFGKYDQLIVPDFNIGAMENIAAVTFSENYVQRQQSSRSEREARASTILHEMAHMWFGNLVTHDWWNGLWLNESFATQMAAIAESNVTEFTDTWHGFFTVGKKAAYQRDSRVTTHPIEMSINATDEFFSVFDAITYQKGSSVLKQLEHLVGDENYRRGVSAYLKDHAYGTTELADFVGHQEKSAGMDLSEWSDEWLYKPGFNTLGSEIDCDAAVLKSLTITQSASAETPWLRTHLVDVALYDVDANGNLVANTILPVRIDGARTVVDVPNGQVCPLLVNPNHNDWTYAQIELSDTAAETLGGRLGNISEPLARSIFLAALFNRAMSGEMPIADYVAEGLKLADTEQNIRVVQQIATSLVQAIDVMYRLQPQTGEALALIVPEIEVQSLRRAHLADSQDLKRIWLNTFLGTVSSDSGIGTVRAMLDGKAEIAGIDMSSDLRWKLLTILSRNGVDGIDEMLEAERLRDASDAGAKSLLTARAAQPDVSLKSDFVDELQQPAAITGLSRQRAVMAGLFPANQTDLQLELLSKVLSALPQMSGKVDPYFMSSYASVLLTPMCQPESVAMLQSALDKDAARLDSTALRFLREAHQADSECLQLRNRPQ